ncbi:MAG: cell division protein FtsK [Candidatus Cloacimonetes bacterium]|nr:cell division protein FtsK [Candidatus Cloacimonadota bacterium]
MEKEGKNKFLQIFFGIIILLFSLLFLVSILVPLSKIVQDYHLLQNAELNFFKFVKLDFPPVSNPIGPFGAFFAFWFSIILGKFFSISLLIGSMFMGFFMIFLAKEKHPYTRITSFIIFAFFANIGSFVISPRYLDAAGIIPWKLYSFLINIFDRTGTGIISSAIVFISLIFIFDIENIRKFLIFIAITVSHGIKALFSMIFSKKPKREKKKKPVKQKKNKTPKITDHAAKKEKQEEFKKPIIPPQKLTQNKDELNDTLIQYAVPNAVRFLSSVQPSKEDREDIQRNINNISRILINKLAEFGVNAEVKNVNIGPIITQYEIEPAPGVKVSKFHALADDLALAIKAKSIRIQAPIPGRGLVGIEIPNKKRDTIYLKDILQSDEMKSFKGHIALGLGKDIAGNPIIADLAAMPHLLIAGATGTGKSVCINTIINSIIFRMKPKEIRFILIDPKRIELSIYEGIPHLIQEVVTDNEDALKVLQWCVSEMERRYELLQKHKVKNIASYNEQVKELLKKTKKTEDSEILDEPIPYIVIVVDELADLIMTIGKDVERLITRLAQMARAIGIHLILATQRPSTQVLTGIIKANIPSRIAFKVPTKIDSRVILDANGADKLLGNGDSLFSSTSVGGLQRIHGAYIEPSEILDIIKYLLTQPKPEQQIKIIKDEDIFQRNYDYDDELFPEAAVAIVSAGSASVSMLQRHFKIGYARAGRLIDMMEQAGIVGPHVGSKSREVLASEEDMKIYGYLPE